MKDNVGILLPVASLPGNHGIGDFGPNAYTFVRWLKRNNYKYWQVLPLNPVGPGNSPYMSTCSEAIEPRYICLDSLVERGLIKKAPKFQPLSTKIQYMEVEQYKEKYLYEAFQNFMKAPKKSYFKFKEENPWLIPFATFIVFRRLRNYQQWNYWPKEMIHYFDEHKDVPEEHKEQCEFHMFMQYIAYMQWNQLWDYAKKQGITIIADCPFYVGIDSTDCWLNKDQFLMDENYHPTLVSGCPPDGFSEDGQLWGTPIYDFTKMRKDKYRFLIHRISYLAKTCDMLRLDHFRAWDTYCVIPAEDENARRGVWWVGPRYEFFDALYKEYPDIKLIAEDLGDLFPGVHELRDHYHLPGMYIVEFCIFDKYQMSKPTQIVYPGTHDNQTLWGWLKSLPEENIEYLKQKFNNPKDMYKTIFEYIWNLPSYLTIYQLQDLIKLDDRGRINYPGTIGPQNWTFKFKDFSWQKRVKFFNK